MFAVQQYFFATNDVNWLKTTGWPIVKGVAEFIASRVRFDTVFQEYVVDGVIPPDEYAFGNNSAYTNVVFRTALIFASYACTIVGETCPQSWQDIIYGIRVPFDNILQYNPEVCMEESVLSSFCSYVRSLFYLFSNIRMDTVLLLCDVLYIGFAVFVIMGSIFCIYVVGFRFLTYSFISMLV